MHDDDEGLVPLGAALAQLDSQRQRLLAQVRLSDSANAERFVELVGEDFRWHAGRACWMRWDGARWAVDEEGGALLATKEVARSWLEREAVGASTEQLRQLYQKHGRASESAGARRAMLTLAAAEDGIAVATSSWDADPWALNVRNGTVDLRTGDLHQHDRRALGSKLADVDYDPTADAPLFRRFLEEALPDTEVREFVQRLIGYSLTGVIREHVLPVFYGSGGNGKGTLVNLLGGILGDYAKAVPADLLMRRQGGDQHPTERATLLGLRLAFASETDAGRQLAEATVKMLTGGDPISARFMRQDFFEFLPTHKLILSTNHRPIIRGSDQGIWRRVRLIPWTTTPRTPNTQLGEQLRAEAPGVLRWAIEGCLTWQRHGLGTAGAVDDAVAAYRAEQDIIRSFLEECCKEVKDATAKSDELYRAYRGWAQEQGEHAWTQRAFTEALRERGYDRRKSNGRMVWEGLGLLDDRPGKPEHRDNRWSDRD